MSLKFAVIHLGARLHYAVPAALEQADMLQRLYTDAHAASPGLTPLRLLPTAQQPRGVRRLFSRRIPAAIPPAKIRSWIKPSLQIEWYNRAQPDRRKEARFWHRRQLGGHWLARQAIADDFGGANALYVHPCTSTDAVREAKRRGMFVVLEAISHPFNKFVENAEYVRFGMQGPEPEPELRENLDFFRAEAELADLILAASPFVRDGLVELGFDPARIAVVPYGLDATFFDSPAQPQPGRALYVGNIGYLKGIPYLAEAARKLGSDGFAGEIRAVGPHPGGLIQRPEYSGPNYIGQVPRAEVKGEFLSADLFVFPTLSDGFGIVLLEAMAAGLPVVTTPNCADVVIDGENGFVVPPRDAGALADRIRQISGDRALRSRMSAAARAMAARFSLSNYGEALTSALEHATKRAPLHA